MESSYKKLLSHIPKQINMAKLWREVDHEEYQNWDIEMLDFFFFLISHDRKIWWKTKSPEEWLCIKAQYHLKRNIKTKDARILDLATQMLVANYANPTLVESTMTEAVQQNDAPKKPHLILNCLKMILLGIKKRLKMFDKCSRISMHWISFKA